MPTCTHAHLELEETAAHYRCAACGAQVVVLRVEEPLEGPAVIESPAPEEGPAPEETPAFDVPGHIQGYVPAKRRLPSKIKR